MRLHLAADVTTCETEDGLVLLDSRRGQYWQLNSTGTAILRALLNSSSPGQAAEQLARKRPVSSEQATEDIHTLVNQLLRAHLVHERNTP